MAKKFKLPKMYDKAKTGMPKVKGTVKQNYMGKKLRQNMKTLSKGR